MYFVVIFLLIIVSFYLSKKIFDCDLICYTPVIATVLTISLFGCIFSIYFIVKLIIGMF